MSPRAIGAAVLIVLAFGAASIGAARAQITNGSFETNTLDGWTTAGLVQTDGSFDATLPSDGSFMAIVSSGFGTELTDDALERFLGIPAGTLDGLGNGDAVDGSALLQFFFANAGEHYAFDWKFITDEPTPSANNDFAVVAMKGVAYELADTGDEPPPPGKTGLQPFCFTTESSGLVDLGVAVLDVGDGTTGSWLLVDNLRMVDDSDGDGIPDPCDFDCPAVPAGNCRSAAKSTLLIKDASDGAKGKMVWNWAKGRPTQRAELGDPTGSTEYRLCLYAGSPPTLLRQIEVPAGGDSWQPVGDKGYKYRDRLGHVEGVTKVLLKGSAKSRSRAGLKASGPALPAIPEGTLPFEPADHPIVVELINNQTGVCFGSAFDAGDVKKNAANTFKARTD